MSVLFEQGKLRFKVRSKPLSTVDTSTANLQLSNEAKMEAVAFYESLEFRRWMKICLELLNRQMNTVHALDETYRELEVVFYLCTDPKTTPLDKYRALGRPSVANGDGTVSVYLPDLKEASDDFKRLLVFEEFIHLVQANGHGHRLPFSWGKLNEQYVKGDALRKILLDWLLDAARHFPVWSILIEAYPEEWTREFASEFSERLLTPKQVRKDHEAWKKDSYLKAEAGACLVVNYLRTAGWMLLFEKAHAKNISKESRKLLDVAMQKARSELNAIGSLMRKEMGSEATRFVDDCVEESVFMSPHEFFKRVFSLWIRLKLFDAV